MSISSQKTSIVSGMSKGVKVRMAKCKDFFKKNTFSNL